MSIIGWLILGLIAGFVASKIVNAQGEGSNSHFGGERDFGGSATD